MYTQLFDSPSASSILIYAHDGYFRATRAATAPFKSQITPAYFYPLYVYTRIHIYTFRMYAFRAIVLAAKPVATVRNAVKQSRLSCPPLRQVCIARALLSRRK